MKIISTLKERWAGIDHPFLIHPHGELWFNEVLLQEPVDLSNVKSGDVVALVGDFNPKSVLTLLQLIDKNVILVPLTIDTKAQHEYFFESALVDFIVEENCVTRRPHRQKHELIESFREQNHAGLVLFSTGTTGRPKAILHDLTLFLKPFETQGTTLRTINFLLFDHIGGFFNLFHTLFNKGTILTPKSRSVQDVLSACRNHHVEVLPTTPTFLRMMLMSGLIPDQVPPTLKIITYGTERMDQPTLNALCEMLPNIDFRQTFGMSELGIISVKSKARDSLLMKVRGEGVETRVVDYVLEIRSATRMLGYLNAENPFDRDGWYNTKDIVEEHGSYYQVTGRTSEVINVGGLKFMASEVERVALQYEGVEITKAEGRSNPITGQHVELIVQAAKDVQINKKELKEFLSMNLAKHMLPKRLTVDSLAVSHRFKRR